MQMCHFWDRVQGSGSGMSLADANECFAAGRSGINVPITTPTGKRRDIGLLRWTSVIKYVPKKKRTRKNNESIVKFLK